MNSISFSATSIINLDNKTAVILAPVMAAWDYGQFCEPLTFQLNHHGFDVTVIDTLSVLTTSNLDFSLHKLKDILSSITNGKPFLIGGVALGGALAQRLSCELPNINRVISISGPTFPSQDLNTKLSSLIEILENDNLEVAMNQLYDWLPPKNGYEMEAPIIESSISTDAIDRMISGFSILKQIDARKSIKEFKGKTLLIVGELSQMVSKENLLKNYQSPTYTASIISNAGMRPWQDNEKQSYKTVEKWL
ncbi:alpha/beta hydrolase family protein [Aliivibrio fischeri]|uniref:hypothetical protein n=1 Tax=Aliivibrio fischeri TaxID=668 RepID=UPI00084C51FC|nr:hypothetical protein [Aliivibrio fischeri]OED53057.1 hypothetical protein BEI47_18205 [Aliivibrio fischeri]